MYSKLARPFYAGPGRLSIRDYKRYVLYVLLREIIDIMDNII